MDAPGYDLLGLLVGSEGQLGVVTEVTVRILRQAEGARPCCSASARSRRRAQTVSDIIGAGIIPVAIEYMDREAIHICEAFAKAGYPLDVEAMLIIEVEGSEAEMEAMLARIVEIARAHDVSDGEGIEVGHGDGGDLEGPQVRLRRHRPRRRLHLHGRHDPDRDGCRTCWRASTGS
jgi:FAD/FMN-containing dehydrogenase